MRKKLIIAILTGMVFFLTAIAQARVTDMTVAVDGMSCPFCAFGVEKRLKKVRGVATVAVDMKTGTADLVAKPKVSIHYQEVPKAIEEAGFTAGAMTITVNGIVEQKNSSFFIQFDGPSIALEHENTNTTAQLSDLAGSGKPVVLHGILSRQTATNWSLTPVSIEETTP